MDTSRTAAVVFPVARGDVYGYQVRVGGEQGTLYLSACMQCS